MTPDQPGGAAPPPPRRRRRGKPFWLAVGLVTGLVVGVGGGYVLFNGKNTTVTSGPAVSPTPSPTAAATPSATASSTAPPVQTPAPVAQGVAPCPVATPLGQHPLGTPGPPGQGQTQNPALDFCGGGNATIPTGTSRFTTGGSWGIGISASCPVGSSGEGGAGTVLTVTEIAIGGGHGPDPAATEAGDWVDSASILMPTGGNYQLQVATVSPSCVWQVDIYPS